MSSKLNVCIIFPRISDVSKLFLNQYIKLIYPLCDNLFLVTKDNIFLIDSEFRASKNITSSNYQPISLPNIKNIVLSEFLMCIKLISIIFKIDIIVSNTTRGTLLFPEILAKLLKKKLVVITGGTYSTIVDNLTCCSILLKLIVKLLIVLERTIYALSDKIVLCSVSEMKNKHGIERYKNKIVYEGARFVDTNLFKNNIQIESREPIIGFIGRFSAEKGITNFAGAIKLLIDKSDFKFLLIGEGPLKNDIELKLKELPKDRVQLLDFLPNEHLPEYLNRMKLLVIPSFTEGLPNVMLEAMACGTPVLASAVGAIPEIIQDGKTGLILIDNSPECIAKRILECINYSDLESISKNSLEMVNNDFSFDVASERYKKIFNSLGDQ